LIDLRVLGPVEVLGTDGEQRAVGGPRPTSILATLALTERASSVDVLIADVWGHRPPPSAVDTLQSYLSRLRRVLAPSSDVVALTRSSAGYRIDPRVVTVDARRFESAVGEGRSRIAGGEPEQACTILRAALELWRGPVGQGLDLGPTARAAATRLEELRLTATEELLDSELTIGNHARVVGELETLALAHPVRERLHGLWMLALYRSGRQAEALQAYQTVRAHLIDVLGVEPGVRLRELQERILGQDPALEPERADAAAVAPAVAPPPGPARAATEVAATGGPGRGAAGEARHEEVPHGDDRPAAGDPARGNLPAALTELIGRDEAREELRGLLGRSRLVTLTGAGGCGKTSLALALAREVADGYPDGVWFIELQAHRRGEEIAVAIAETLGVDDAPEPELVDRLAARLANRRALLVLDNCEHVVDPAATLVHALLSRCPGLQVLATSRQPLDLDGEVAWRVPSLAVADRVRTVAELLHSDAARLFLARAQAVAPSYLPSDEDAVAIASICRDLDGIPLAIELAAARVRVLSVDELASRLDDRFAVLRSTRRGAPARHRTLEAAVQWSYDLLDEPARRLFLRLSVFEGGATAAAIEATCADGLLPRGEVLGRLEELVDRSLVVTTTDPVGPARHELLQSLRSFARSRLPDAERDELAARHAGWFAGLADEAVTQLTGIDQVRWLNALHANQPDLRAALRWTCDQGRFDLALRIVRGVWWFWLQFGHAREGSGWAERVLDAIDAGGVPGSDDDVGAAIDPTHLIDVRFAAGRLAGAQGEHHTAVIRLREAARAAADAGATDRMVLARARLAHQLAVLGDEAGAGLLTEVVEQAEGVTDRWVLAGVSDVVGHLAAAADDLDAAWGALAASEEHYLAVDDRWSACLSRLGLAWVARRREDWSAALDLHAQNLASTRSLTRSAFDFVGLARDLRGIAAVAATCGQDAIGIELCTASEDLRTMGEVALTPDEHAEVEAVRAHADRVLAGDARVSAERRGRALAPADALARALASIDPLRSQVVGTGSTLAGSTTATYRR
jgi:predicted ATPase/DNA-binding SARP family transcriptional activator